MDSDDEMMVQLFTEEQNAQAPFFVVPRRGGSKPGKRRNINMHREAGAMLLDADYFNDDTTHSPKEFRHRFRMNKDLFLKIVHGVREYTTYFMAKKDCTGELPFCLAGDLQGPYWINNDTNMLQRSSVFARLAKRQAPAVNFEMWEVMNAYVIIHNMIIESERDTPVQDDHPFDYQGPLAEVEYVPQEFVAFLHMHNEIRDVGAHAQLKADLAAHLWAKRGAANNA
ncbi:uncharacterized protein [Lolium perenne]|uniref:uncharacterized protein n=1 Tax=Lolium perenne TaxID=4522 RepID=UPI003A9961BA